METIKSMQKTKAMRFYLAMMVVLMGTGAAYTQTPELGIRAGVNFGSLNSSSDAVTSASGKAGVQVGLFARTVGNFYFQPEVNFSTFGSRYSHDADAYEPSFRQLNVPLMVGYKLINNDQVNFRVSLGPDLYFNLNRPDTPTGTEYRRFSMGGVVNAGVDVGRITFDARYGLGLTAVHEELEQKQRVFGLSIGFKIL